MDKLQKNDNDREDTKNKREVTGTEDRSASSKESVKKHIRGSTLLLAGRVIGVLTNFGVHVLIVRYLAKAEYGAFAYAYAIMMLGSHVVALGLNKGLSRFVPIYQERGEYERMAGTIVLVLCTMVVLGTAMVALAFGLAGVIGGHLAPDPLALTLLLILVWVAPLQALDDVSVKLFAIFATPRAVFFRRHILTPGLRLTAVLALVFFEGDAVFLALAYIAVGVLGVTISLLIIVRLLRDKGLLQHFRREKLDMPARRVFRFSIPLLSSDLVAALRGTLVVFFLGFYQGSVSVAAFRSVYSVARLNGMVFDSFRLLFEPTAGRMYARDDRTGINEIYWRTASWIVVFTFPIFVASFALAQPLTVLLFGEQYADSGMILALLAIGSFLNAAFGYNALTLRIFHKVRAIVAIDLTVMVLALLLYVLLIPKFGALGGAMASSAVIASQNVLYQVVLIRLDVVKAIDARFLRVISTVVVVAAVVFGIQSIFAPPLYVGITLAAVASLLVLSLTGPLLDIEIVFPEIKRFAAARRLLRIPDDPGASSQNKELRSSGSTSQTEDNEEQKR